MALNVILLYEAGESPLGAAVFVNPEAPSQELPVIYFNVCGLLNLHKV